MSVLGGSSRIKLEAETVLTTEDPIITQPSSNVIYTNSFTSIER